MLLKYLLTKSMTILFLKSYRNVFLSFSFRLPVARGIFLVPIHNTNKVGENAMYIKCCYCTCNTGNSDSNMCPLLRCVEQNEVQGLLFYL